MKISKLTQSNRKEDRAVIHLDNGDSFSIHKDLIVENQLWAGKEITDELLLKVQKADLFYKLLDKALRKVSARPQSDNEIRQSLNTYIFKNKLVVENTQIEAVMNRLVELGFVDDERFAKHFVERRSGKKSPKELKNLLRQKRVAPGIIDKVIGEAPDNESEIIGKLAAKKIKSYSHKSLNERDLKQKVLTFLYRKGFDLEKSRTILDKLINSNGQNY